MTSRSAHDPGRLRVVLRVTSTTSGAARTAVSAAVQLFRALDPVDVHVECGRPGGPEVTDLERVTEWCAAAVASASQLPDLQLVDADEADAVEAHLDLRVTDDALSAADAVQALSAAARNLRRGVPADRAALAESADRAAAAAAASTAVERLTALVQRREAQLAAALRDAGRASPPGRSPVIAALFQHPKCWSAVSALYAELAHRAELDLRVVALESHLDDRTGSTAMSTAEFVRTRGHRPWTLAWLLGHLDEVDVVLVDNPYDAGRPAELSAAALAARGIRIAFVPYGMSGIDGAFMTRLTWDLPLHRLAWRCYLPNDAQAAAMGEHCATGAEPARVLGTPKQDSAVRAEPSAVGHELLRAAAGRPLVVWNPHFRTEAGGWSTFTWYARELVREARRRDDLLLVVRPHFMLFGALARSGQQHLEDELRRAHREGVLVLDESDDYLGVLAVADAMLSDLSSLATEFCLMGRPLLYLHRADGPGYTEEGGYFGLVDRAEEWPEVVAFLDRVVAGTAALTGERARAVAAHFPLADGSASSRIADDLVSSLCDVRTLAAAG